MVVWLLLSCQPAKRERERDREKGIERERERERWTFPLLFHLLFQPLTYFCCQLQLFLPISLLLPSIFLPAGHQSPHPHFCFCRSSVTGYYFSSILCLLLLCGCIPLFLFTNLSLLLQEEVSRSSLDTEAEGETEREIWKCEVIQYNRPKVTISVAALIMHVSNKTLVMQFSSVGK